MPDIINNNSWLKKTLLWVLTVPEKLQLLTEIFSLLKSCNFLLLTNEMKAPEILGF